MFGAGVYHPRRGRLSILITLLWNNMGCRESEIRFGTMLVMDSGDFQRGLRTATEA